MEVGGYHHALTALPLGKRHGTHWIGGWVGPRSSLDGCWKSRPHRDLSPWPSSLQQVAIPTELFQPTLHITSSVKYKCSSETNRCSANQGSNKWKYRHHKRNTPVMLMLFLHFRICWSLIVQSSHDTCLASFAVPFSWQFATHGHSPRQTFSISVHAYGFTDSGWFHYTNITGTLTIIHCPRNIWYTSTQHFEVGSTIVCVWLSITPTDLFLLFLEKLTLVITAIAEPMTLWVLRLVLKPPDYQSHWHNTMKDNDKSEIHVHLE